LNSPIVQEPASVPAPAGQLLAELARGDPAALERWFRQHESVVYSFAYFRLGRDADLAADATQATFARALERLDEFDPGRAPMVVWLCTLARNVIRRLAAEHRRDVQLDALGHGAGEMLQASLNQLDCQPLPESVVQRQQTRELVAISLAALPRQYQAVLEARYMDGQPLEEIARRRDSTVDGVKSMLRRARQAFRESFLALAGADADES